jgi:hypothetical protein
MDSWKLGNLVERYEGGSVLETMSLGKRGYGWKRERREEGVRE